MPIPPVYSEDSRQCATCVRKGRWILQHCFMHLQAKALKEISYYGVKAVMRYVMSGVEDQESLDAVLNRVASEIVDSPENFRLLEIFNEHIAHLNKYLEPKRVGDRLYDQLKEHAKNLTSEEALHILQYARMRLHLHTQADGKEYKTNYSGIDDCIDQLPVFVIELKQDPETAEHASKLMPMFIDYCRMESPNYPLSEFKECFRRFVKVKEFYETKVPEDCKDLPALRDTVAGGSWDKLRERLKSEAQFERYKAVIDDYERIERAQKVNFTNVLSFISKYRRSRNGPTSA